MCRSQRPRATYCASRCAVSGRSVWKVEGVSGGRLDIARARGDLRRPPLALRDDGERGDFGAGLGGADGLAGGGRRLVVGGEELFQPIPDGREGDLALEERGE